MNTIVKEVIIPDSDRMHIEVELPEGFPAGKAVMTLKPKDMETKYMNNAARMCGKGKGKVWMSNDFNAPLADFADYM